MGKRLLWAHNQARCRSFDLHRLALISNLVSVKMSSPELIGNRTVSDSTLLDMEEMFEYITVVRCEDWRYAIQRLACRDALYVVHSHSAVYYASKMTPRSSNDTPREKIFSWVLPVPNVSSEIAHFSQVILSVHLRDRRSP